MPFDSDVALLGTGVAPLVAAKKLLEEGRTVLLLNPDFDYFREDSELPFDPLWPVTPETLAPQRLGRSTPERALQELRPFFPGAIEEWPGHPGGASGFHDPLAPHVRARSRLWLRPAGKSALGDSMWDSLEGMYVEASDAGLKPQILEGLPAVKRFPGASARAAYEDARAVLVPKLVDVDVARYRNGLLEFIRERVEPHRIVCEASQIDLMPEGVRFHAAGQPRTAKLGYGMLVFWTPRLTQWILSQARKAEAPPVLPKGVRLWEEWSLVSREALDPSSIGAIEGMSVWAEAEGAPDAPQAPLATNRLSVLRAGPLLDVDARGGGGASGRWASADSFGALSRLCNDFLKWDRFSVRSLRPRAILEWDRAEPWSLTDDGAEVVTGCDGPLVDVVRTARLASERALERM